MGQMRQKCVNCYSLFCVFSACWKQEGFHASTLQMRNRYNKCKEYTSLENWLKNKEEKK